MSQHLYNSQTESIRLGHKIGVGGEGEVFEVQDRSDLVAKIYFSPPPAERAEKLALLIRLGNERLSKLSAWPVDLLRDQPDDSQADSQAGGQIRGFLMQKINEAEEVHTLHSPKSRLQKFPEASWKFLIYVAANFARAVAAIHEHGFVIGDVNPKNTLVTRKATIYLLDCDSFQVSVEGRTYRCEGGFPEYTPPELQQIPFREVDRSQEHDCFGLAIVIFQLLFMGRHPFSGQFLGAGEMSLERAIKEYRWAYGRDAETREMRQPPGTLKLEAVPEPMQELFRRAFLSIPRDRPQPREWVESLESLSQSLTKCEHHSGHDYYRELSVCPWCEIETRAGAQLFNISLNGAGHEGGHFRLDQIWKEIAAVEAPRAMLMPQIAPNSLLPSVSVAPFIRKRRSDLIYSIVIAFVMGVAIALMTDAPLSIWLILLATIPVISVVKALDTATGPGQSFLLSGQPLPNNSLIQEISNFKQRAAEEVEKIEEQWKREAEGDRFLIKRNDLRSQKEAYEDLSKTRAERLKRLEFVARVEQQGNVLVAHDVSARARLEIEKEIGHLRLRLERQLTSGPFYLRRIKEEIETRRQELQPALLNARQSLARAEKDLEVATRHNNPVPALLVLIVTFSFWSIGEMIEGDFINPKPLPLKIPMVVQQQSDYAFISKKYDDAVKLYNEGVKYSEEGKYQAAVNALSRATALDSRYPPAYRELGAALYNLERYNESAEASSMAIRLDPGQFEPYYNLGLVRMGQMRWAEAKVALTQAVDRRGSAPSPEKYAQAFYHLGLSLKELGEVQSNIQLLEESLQVSPTSVVNRFELGILYLWASRAQSAMEQYQILKDQDWALAEELKKLIRNHQ